MIVRACYASKILPSTRNGDTFFSCFLLFTFPGTFKFCG
ncbi:hypothetical protein EC07798_4549 [Escherichia coli 07798]|nr:hypothetical protein ECRN5871_2134 [Escherichia coli RN587/1]EKI22647.1 hypothetical protein ECARS42123_4363 [Escherichia coli ARS4.2123]EKI34941.1 hypothetical protein EC07798_4549 [Escherichia coli 07798]KDZ48722.1 hypothetical protein AB16_3627 [Escherichia coli 3-073-06_S1_C1]